MTPQTEQEIEKLRTLNDNYTALVDIFDHLVPREYVVLTLSAPSDVDWTMYSVVVTNNDKGTSDTYVIPSNGVLEFEIKYDTTYTIKLPVFGDFIAPKDLTFTAGMKMREVWYSYRIAGIFGIDANGKYYSIEQIEALEDKSIIKYGGYTDEELENSARDDGRFGNSFIWDLDNTKTVTNASYSWSSEQVEFSQELLPFVSTNDEAYKLFKGEDNTRYIISEGLRLGLTTTAASFCVSNKIQLGDNIKTGFLITPGQIYKLVNNYTLFNNLYIACGLTTPNIKSDQFITSGQLNAKYAWRLNYGSLASVVKISNQRVFLVYPLN